MYNFNVPEYKYIDFKKLLLSKKWILKRTKGSHERWQSPKGKLITVPHHKNLQIGLYKKLLKQVLEDEND